MKSFLRYAKSKRWAEKIVRMLQNRTKRGKNPTIDSRDQYLIF